MNKNLKRLIGVLLCIQIAFPMSPAYAWGPIAHWIIAEETGCDPKYANLPDAWPSQWGFIISEKFCWSHAVLDKGEYADTVPAKPEYPRDGRYPEFVMQILAKHKLSAPSDDMFKTAEGFACHNAADSVVHWEYFEGGTSDNWLEDHLYKELWAEYVILTYVRLNFTSGSIFDFNTGGNVKAEHQFTLSATGNAKILQLAQKVYIKNGRYTDYDGTDVLDKDTLTEINTLINDLNTEIATKVGELRFQNTEAEDEANPYRFAWLQHMHWQELQMMAAERGWSILDCLERYNKSIVRVNQWKEVLGAL